MSIHLRDWSEKERRDLAKARSFKEMARVAAAVMKRMPKNIHVVSGPISTGGVGTNVGNIKVFQGIVEILNEEKGLNVLSWIPFELKVRELLAEWHKINGKGSYCMPILDDFYYAVFTSGKICKVHFIHGWESSFGSSWEHKLCEKLGIEMEHLSPEISQKALARKMESVSIY